MGLTLKIDDIAELVTAVFSQALSAAGHGRELVAYRNRQHHGQHQRDHAGGCLAAHLLGQTGVGAGLPCQQPFAQIVIGQAAADSERALVGDGGHRHGMGQIDQAAVALRQACRT